MLSYVIARPLMTAVSVVANIAGVYGEGEFRRDRWAAGAAAACSCVNSYVALGSMAVPDCWCGTPAEAFHSHPACSAMSV